VDRTVDSWSEQGLISLKKEAMPFEERLIHVWNDAGRPKYGIFNARPKLPDQKWTDTPWHQDAQYYQDG
jgi:phytanoyl-CoA hydroxylase